VRNLKVRYQRSVLGFLWALLNPLVTIAILVAVFGYIVRIGVPDYWAFLVSGYFAWVFLLHTLTASASVITDHAYMVKSVAVPAELLVLSGAIARLVEFLAEMALVLVVLALWHHGGIPAGFALLPLLAALQFLLTVGLAMPIAALSVFFHDVQHALPAALLMLAYLSPVFYPAQYVPASVRPLYLLNPVAALLTLYHTALYEGRVPPAAQLGAAAAVALAVFLLGYAAFRRYRAVFAEIV
jgi:ABC-type polysaccharide/polyol phosphate export permease